MENNSNFVLILDNQFRQKLIFFKTHRLLASNYWDCPVPNYISGTNNDYSTANNQCCNSF